MNCLENAFSETRRLCRHKKRAGTGTPQPLVRFTRGYYLSRSLALPILSLAVPFVWSFCPSDFLASSPVTAPVASLALPFALSRVPSPLSWLLLFLPTRFSLLRSSSRAVLLFLPVGELA